MLLYLLPLCNKTADVVFEKRHTFQSYFRVPHLALSKRALLLKENVKSGELTAETLAKVIKLQETDTHYNNDEYFVHITKPTAITESVSNLY